MAKWLDEFKDANVTLELAGPSIELVPEFGVFIGNLAYWLGQSLDVNLVVVKPITPNSVELEMFDVSRDEGDQEFYIGNFADPGMVVEWVGEFNGKPLVECNGILFEALGKHVAAWAVGCE